MSISVRFRLSVVVLICVIFQTQAEEGFWPLDRVPADYLRERYACDVSPEWLTHVSLASVRIDGHASGAFVSAHGLVMTNRHVVATALQNASLPGKTNLIEEGFLARKRDDEIPAPGMRLEQLIETVDITDAVQKMCEREKVDRRSALQRIGRAARMSNRESNIAFQAVDYQPYGGCRILKYKIYEDVRLVFAAELSAGYFGGDTDNFMYPRHAFDVAFVRAYENGIPAETPEHFTWSPASCGPRELLFICGNPGPTQRNLPAEWLEAVRDAVLPAELCCWTCEAAQMARFAALGETQKQQIEARMHAVNNQLKRVTGQLQSLQQPDTMQRKRALNAPAASRDIKQNLNALAEEEYTLLNSPFGFRCALLTLAERAARKENLSDREARIGPDERLFIERRYYYDPARARENERALFEESLSAIQKLLPSTSPLLQMLLDGQQPVQRADELLSKTHLCSEKSVALPQLKDDPLLDLGRKLQRYRRELVSQHEFKLLPALNHYYDDLTHASTPPIRAYPDGTLTQRLSFGVLNGLCDHGNYFGWQTQLGTMFDLAGTFDHSLFPRWQEARSKLNLCTPLNFVTDADTIAGNSGSPVFNRKREIVGLFFDSNYPGLLGGFIFDAATKRSVCVDSRAIVEVLNGVYGAGELVKEFRDTRQ